MSIRASLLAFLLFAGPHELLEAQPARHVREILSVVFETIELEPDDQVFAGTGLHPIHSAALSRVIAGELREVRPTSEYLVPANAVVVESLQVSGRTASVRLTYGPVPRVSGLQCGQAITLALRHKVNWEVEGNESWVKCANPATQPGSRDEARLREVIGLVMSHLRVEPAVRVVAGPKLAPAARAVLQTLTALVEADAVQTQDDLLPRDHLKIHTLTLTGDVASFEATQGPVPRRATLDCGTSVSMRLRRRAGGWFFEEIKHTVC